ncbi:hypothetical protein M3795_16840 [Ralstonia pickettii]|jgi:hypothetical protein|uniref:Uncharacterized protein n=1 Tax=Ralstonia pickettii OR214 TaxID=1264675 RepID=R0EE67_RALPI|nr:hypothetical protein [Ralstonia pickettii]ENZ79617.1 hypothetical protein OR214_00034 [Ralstonia pickettii OR214]MCM3582151.1 hypothetical protein [Ralstonia pickettii]
MSKTISMREFARRENCSDTLVRRAVKQGRLKVSKDGNLDERLVGTAWREANAKGANTSANRGANTANSSQGIRSSQFAPEQLAPQVLDGESLTDAASRIVDEVELVDYAEALQKKENYLALLRQLEYEEKSGSLVQLATAEAILFEEFRAQRDAWLNWPTRVGPLLAAELGIEADRLTEVLTAHVHKQIAQLGQPEANFTEREG